jgi:hypothetical protein
MEGLPAEIRVTDEERDEVLRLLANYEDMVRAMTMLVRVLRDDPSVELDAHHAGLVSEVAALAPVWREFAGQVRSRLMLERRQPSPDPPRDAYHGVERRRSWDE